MPELTLEQHVRLELLKSFIDENLIKDSRGDNLRSQHDSVNRFVNMTNIMDFAVQYAIEGKSDKFIDNVNTRHEELDKEYEEQEKANEDERAKKNIEKAINGVNTAIAAFTAATSKA